MEKSLLTLCIALILLFTLVATRQAQGQTKKNTATEHQKAVPVVKPAPPVPPPPPLPAVSVAAAAPTPAPPPAPVAVPASGEPAPAPKAVAIDMLEVEPVAPVEPVTAKSLPLPPQAPLSPLAPMVSAGLPLRDTLSPGKSDFTRLSTTINDDGKTRTESVEATGKDGKTYRINKLNGAVTYLSVDGVEVPKEKYADYQPLLDRLEKTRKDNIEKARLKRLKVQEIRLDTKKWAAQQADLRIHEVALAKLERRKLDSDIKILLSNALKNSHGLALKKGFELKTYQGVSIKPTRVTLFSSHKSVPLFTPSKKIDIRPVVLKPGRVYILGKDESKYQ